MTDKIILLLPKWSSRASFMPLAQRQAMPAQLAENVALDCAREALLALKVHRTSSCVGERNSLV